MRLTKEREAQIRGDVHIADAIHHPVSMESEKVLLAEIDALRAELAAKDAELKAAQEESARLKDIGAGLAAGYDVTIAASEHRLSRAVEALRSVLDVSFEHRLSPYDLAVNIAKQALAELEGQK